MLEKNYELIKFHANWADEFDVNSLMVCTFNEYEKLIKDLNLKVKVEVDRNEQLQRNLTLFVTDEYTKKQILRLYAMGNSTTYIHKILNGVKQMDVTFETISDIVTNLKNKDLEQDDLDYYAEESKL